ncbi:MAG: alpha-amylase/4-alpha-glucanotransferase domain-containing protein [bacterium]
MNEIGFALCFHSHQPIGNFEHVLEEAYRRAYLPLIEVLKRHPSIKISLHYTGILLDWFRSHYPEIIEDLKGMVEEGRLELLTGGFYEPIMGNIPDRDKIGQIKSLSKTVEGLCGYSPQGMWVAERVWEPYLAKPIVEAGVKYIIIDDAHFLQAGFKGDDLFGYYMTEEEGKMLAVFPGSKELRYIIPFAGNPAELIDFLRNKAEQGVGRLALMADDGEKFGLWPGTFDWVFGKGRWLDRLFDLVEQNSDWIKTYTLSSWMAQQGPLGRAYLPTGSYAEMMEWAMPAESILLYEDLLDHLKAEGILEKYSPFIRGGFWRNFLVKYPESNQMHKKMLYVSDKVAMLPGNKKITREARDELWKGQCNCAYWHGVFGGLYLPHLRSAIYQHLITAETLADKEFHAESTWLDVDIADLDKDSYREILINTDQLNLYFHPKEGGCLFELDWKPNPYNILDTLSRRKEAYHQKLLSASGSGDDEGGGTKSIHDLVRVKEKGLEDYLNYDWYRRLSLIDHFLREDTTLEDFAACKYWEQGDFVNQPYLHEIQQRRGEAILTLARHGHVWVGPDHLPVQVVKRIKMRENLGELRIDYEVTNSSDRSLSLWFGVEFNFAMLGGHSPDRYYFIPGRSLRGDRLDSRGETRDVTEFGLRDEFLHLEIRFRLNKEATLWRFPIETVSQSEGGFERIYQSSVLLPNFRFSLSPGEVWKVELVKALNDMRIAD